MSCSSATCSRSALPKIDLVQPPAVHVPAPFGWVQVVKRMQGRWQQRRTLLDLDDRLLRDIGLTREEAKREGRRPFWH